MVFSTMLIGFVGFGVWSHHLFTLGFGPVVNTIFALATMIIAVPTGIKMFNWIGTLWKGRLKMTAAMMYALGFLALFLIGGLTGVQLSAAPANTQIHHTYFVVGHFHYVMIGGALFSLFGAMHYWWPKMFGRMMDERLGKVTFWILFIGFNLTFFPMHIMGVQGMPRRIYTYSAEMGWDIANLDLDHRCVHDGRGGAVGAVQHFHHDAQAEGRPGGPVGRPYVGVGAELSACRAQLRQDSGRVGSGRLLLPKYPHLEPLAGATAEETAAAAEMVEEEEEIVMPGGSYMPLFMSIGLVIASYGLLLQHAGVLVRYRLGYRRHDGLGP